MLQKCKFSILKFFEVLQNFRTSEQSMSHLFGPKFIVKRGEVRERFIGRENRSAGHLTFRDALAILLKKFLSACSVNFAFLNFCFL